MMLQTFTAYFDLLCCPASYDVVSFIMLSERKRLEKGVERVAIEILPGPQDGFRRDHMWPYSTWERRNLLSNVVLPMCSLLPSCERVTVHGMRVDKTPDSFGHSEYTISFKEFCDTYAKGVRPLCAKKEQIFPGFRVITMTLRECEHWPERNTNTVEWLKAAKLLGAMSQTVVVIVRDTLCVDHPELEGESIDEITNNYNIVFDKQASYSLLARATLYASANVNLFVNNGPAWLSLALDAPSIVFRPVTDTKCWAHTAEAMASFGVPTNGQMKGTPLHQCLSWVPETAYDLVNKVDDFFEQQLGAAA